MKSALIRVLCLLCAICVFGDADNVETISLKEGGSVTLLTGVTEIQSSDVIVWRFNGIRIAQISGGTPRTEGPFSDRLQLDKQTGNLKITNIKTTDSGEYKLKITSTSGSPEKTFSVSVSADEGMDVSVLVGDTVTLHTDLTKTQIYDAMQWTFGHLNSSIAEISRAAGIFSTNYSADWRFRDRLKMDCLTGSLTIRNIRTTHSGLYEVDISSSTYTIHKSFSVTVSDGVKSVPVMEGKPVPLQTGVTKIQTDDFILWMFEDTRIAVTDDVPDGRFQGRLKLDKQTGSLTVRDTRPEDSGLYELQVSSSRRTIHRRFTVTVSGLGSGSGSGLSAEAVVGIAFAAAVLGFGAGAVVAVAAVIFYRRRISELKNKIFQMLWATEGESVTLKAEIRKADGVQVKFRDALIAERKTANGEFTVHDGIFKDRLQLEKGSGYLIITNTSSDMSGDYELRILRRGQEILKTFIVTVLAKSDLTEMKIVMEGESFTLPSGVTGTQRDDQLEWKFKHEDSPIAQIKGGIQECFPSAAGGRFGDRLMLDKNGSLTITNTKTTDAGVYGLYNTESGDQSIKSFNVVVLFPKHFKNNPEEVPLMRVGVSDSCL